ncbi:unnamed protein product, partial [Nesidiocoris tenuis]
MRARLHFCERFGASVHNLQQQQVNVTESRAAESMKSAPPRSRYNNNKNSRDANSFHCLRAISSTVSPRVRRRCKLRRNVSP